MVITELVLPWLLHDRSWGLYDKNLNKHLRWERADGWFKQAGLVVLQKGLYIRDTEIFLCDSAFFRHYFSGNGDACNQYLIILFDYPIQVLADLSTLIHCETLFNRTEAEMLGFRPEVRDLQWKEGGEPEPTVVFLIHLSWDSLGFLDASTWHRRLPWHVLIVCSDRHERRLLPPTWGKQACKNKHMFCKYSLTIAAVRILPGVFNPA